MLKAKLHAFAVIPSVDAGKVTKALDAAIAADESPSRWLCFT